MQDGSRIARLVEMSRAGLDRKEPSGTGRVLDALAVHVADLPDDVLAEMVRAGATLAGWAAGVQARAAGELVLRSQGFTGFEQATTMVSGELRETRKTGRTITVRAAAGLSHPVVIDHLSTGRIDAPRADALLLAGRSLSEDQRAKAIEELLPIAPERSAHWLATEMRKRARSLEPGKASKAARESRAVFHDVCEDEMGTLTAFLPAVDSAAVWGVIDDLAQQIRRTDDARTLGQLRADVLTSIVTGRLVPERRARNDACAMDKDVTDAGGTDHGDTDDGDTDDGDTVDGGTVDGGTVDGGTVDGGTVDGGTDGERHAERDDWPIVRLTPTRPVVRVTVPLDALRTHAGGSGNDNRHDRDRSGAEDPITPEHEESPHGESPHGESPEDAAAPDVGGGAAWLDGFGPLSAVTAARIAFDPDSTWYRLVTDPITGVLADYSTRAYQPPKPLADAVRLRDATCRGPGCEVDARWCDLDHIDPYDKEHEYRPGEPGQTRADNLQALCRTHHRLKTKYGWRVRRDPESAITYWTAPTGRRYTKTSTSTDPEPTSFKEFVRARTAIPSEPQPDVADRPETPEEPPF